MIEFLNQLNDKFWILGTVVALGMIVVIQPTELMEKAFWLALGSLLTVLKGNITNQNFMFTKEDEE